MFLIKIMTQMLHAALGETVSYMCPNVPKVLESVCNTLKPYTHSNLCTPVYTLLSDVGPVAAPDLSLAACLAQLQLTAASTSSPDLLRLFPIACACVFASDKWESSVYNYDLNAFERNEHTAMIAAAALMVGFFVGGDDENAQQQPPSSSRSSISGATSGAGISMLRNMCELFVKTSAQLLLTLRSTENNPSSTFTYSHSAHTQHSYTYANRPLRAMSTLLEVFFLHLPAASKTAQGPTHLLSLADVERYHPYTLTHSCLMDVCLGKHKEADTLKTFTHMDSLYATFSGKGDSNASNAGGAANSPYPPGKGQAGGGAGEGANTGESAM